MIKILFLSAEPSDAPHLRIPKELREIREALQKNRLNDQFTIKESLSTRPKDFIQAMIDFEPDIVHFSGHGSTAGELCLEDDTGKSRPAPANALGKLFKQFRDKTSCVVLNACSTKIQVRAIADHCYHVIGTRIGISDDAAIGFSLGFYRGLGSGKDVQEAFELGCAAMEMSDTESEDVMFLTKGDGGRPLNPVQRPESVDLFQRSSGPPADAIPNTSGSEAPPVGHGKTVPTGCCFISYKRSRVGEVSNLVGALHDHGIPTWQDLRDLDRVHTETRIAEVLEDAGTSSAVLWISPDVKDSPMIKGVEAPAVIKRAKAGDGFFVMPALVGGLGYGDIPNVLGPRYTHETLGDWNLKRIEVDPITDKEAAEIAREILEHRVRQIHRSFPKGEPFRIEVYTRPPAIVNEGVALTVDWTHRFDNREATTGAWDAFVLPSLRSVVHAVVSRAPGRPIELSGSLVISAATALGVGFLARRDVNVTWKQVTRPGYQYWNLDTERQPSGFEYDLERRSLEGRDLAVLVSVARDVEQAFFDTPDLPAFRAILKVTKRPKGIHTLSTPGQAVDLAHIVEEGIEQARTSLKIGTIHLFMAVPVGLAFMIGQLLNVLGNVQTYELVSDDATGGYRPAAVLRPSY